MRSWTPWAGAAVGCLSCRKRQLLVASARLLCIAQGTNPKLRQEGALRMLSAEGLWHSWLQWQAAWPHSPIHSVIQECGTPACFVLQHELPFVHSQAYRQANTQSEFSTENRIPARIHRIRPRAPSPSANFCPISWAARTCVRIRLFGLPFGPFQLGTDRPHVDGIKESFGDLVQGLREHSACKCLFLQASGWRQHAWCLCFILW